MVSDWSTHPPCISQERCTVIIEKKKSQVFGSSVHLDLAWIIFKGCDGAYDAFQYYSHGCIVNSANGNSIMTGKCNQRQPTAKLIPYAFINYEVIYYYRAS